MDSVQFESLQFKAHQQTLRYKVREPKSGYFDFNQNDSQSQYKTTEVSYSYKQIARIVQHLCKDLKFSHPQLTIPSEAMLRCLCFNACNHSADIQQESLSNWQSLIGEVLKTIRNHTDVGLDKSCDFVDLNGATPLFPNSEQFDEWDAFRLSQALLHYLEKELN